MALCLHDLILCLEDLTMLVTEPSGDHSLIGPPLVENNLTACYKELHRNITSLVEVQSI